MNALVELIKKIGIFMIAAQALIHFAPEHKYEKYIKLIVGIMVLLQLLSPLYRITKAEEPDWSTFLSGMEQEFSSGELSGDILKAPSIEDTLIANIEQEIKSKLNDSIADKNYRVINVVVRLAMQNKPAGYGKGDDGENGTNQYSFDKVRVAVQTYGDDSPKEAGKIQIEKIILEGSSEEGQSEAHADSRQDSADALRKKFCEILGMEEEDMEVSVYGTMEETDK